MSTTTEHPAVQRKSLTLIDTLQLISDKGLSACYIPYSLTKDGGFIQAAYSDFVFISVDYYAKNRFDLLRKHLDLIKSKKSVFVGISTFYNEEVFGHCLEMGIEKFLFKPITEEVLISELEEDFKQFETDQKATKPNSLIKLQREQLALSKTRLDHIFNSSIIYSEALNSLNSDLFFRKRLNHHVYFSVGEGRKSTLENSLLAADMVHQLDTHLSIKNWYNNTIFSDLQSVMKMPFEFVELNGKEMEMRYHGNGNAIHIRKNRILTMPQDQPVPVKYDDVVFLFSDGLEQQIGHRDMPFGRTELENFLLFLSRIAMEDMKNEIAVFLENWRNQRPQNDDITLMAFRI